MLRGRGVVTSRANASDTSVLQAAAARCCINWASSSAVSPDAVSITWPRGAFQARAAQARTRAAAPSSQRSCSGHAQPVCLLLALRARAHLRPQHLQLGPVMPLLMHLSSLVRLLGLPPKVVGAKCANSGSHLPHLRSTFTSDVSTDWKASSSSSNIPRVRHHLEMEEELRGLADHDCPAWGPRASFAPSDGALGRLQQVGGALSPRVAMPAILARPRVRFQHGNRDAHSVIV